MRVVGLCNPIVDFYLYDDKILLNGGGTVSNILVNLSSFGIKTSIIGYYGSDHLGSYAKESLELAHVDTTNLERKNFKTKIFFIDENGTTSACPFCGNKRKNYKAKTNIKEFIREDDLILIQDFYPMRDLPNKIIWDFGYSQGIIYMDKQELEALMFREYYMVNIKKSVLGTVLKKLDITFCEFKSSMDIEFLIITDGKNGSKIVYNRKEYDFKPQTFSEIETNGCGDIYFATFISEFIKKNRTDTLDIESIQNLAQKNVENVISRIGARDHITKNTEILPKDKCICEDFTFKN